MIMAIPPHLGLHLDLFITRWPRSIVAHATLFALFLLPQVRCGNKLAALEKHENLGAGKWLL
jgi:hypothetical protein